VVWPLNHRRQVPFGRRQIPFATPAQVQHAPLELLRSHLYPVDPRAIAQAVLQGAMQNYPPNNWLPLRMTQQQWKKSSTGFYRPHDSSVNGYIRALRDSGAQLRTARAAVPQHPSLPWDVMSAQLQATIDMSRGGSEMGFPLARNVPSPGRLPSQYFDAMDDFEMFAANRQQRFHRNERMAAMRRIRQLDREYNRFTEKPR